MAPPVCNWVMANSAKASFVSAVSAAKCLPATASPLALQHHSKNDFVDKFIRLATYQHKIKKT
jgi:hypothetical protein